MNVCQDRYAYIATVCLIQWVGAVKLNLLYHEIVIMLFMKNIKFSG